jgi:hypothetical protein
MSIVMENVYIELNLTFDIGPKVIKFEKICQNLNCKV